MPSQFSELKAMAQDELKKKLSDLQAEVLELRMKNPLGQVSNPMRIRVARRQIARVKMALAAKPVKRSK